MNGARPRLSCAGAAAAVGLLSAGQTTAQVVSPTQPEIQAPTYTRGNNVSVLDRERPQFEAIGGRTGPFLILPRIQSDLEFNDNLFAEPGGGESDVILRVSPDVRLRAETGREALELFARVTRNQPLSNDEDAYTTFDVGGLGRRALGDGRVFGGLSLGRFVEPRTDLNARRQNVEPTEFDAIRANVGVLQTFSRTRLSARFDLRDFDYEDGRDATGAAIEFDDRDQLQAILSGKAEYGVSPDTAAFVEVQVSRRDYETPIPGRTETRSNDGLELTAGVNFDLTRLARGEIQAGFTRREYEARNIGAVSAFAARGRLEYFPTQLTTVTLDLNRRVEDSGDVVVAGYVSTDVSLRADHELLRNVILTARLGLGRDEFETIDRQADRLSVSFSGVYLVNRRLGLRLTYAYLEEDGSGRDARPGYEQNRLILGTVVQF